MGRGERNQVRRGNNRSKPTPSVAPRLRVRPTPKARPAVQLTARSDGAGAAGTSRSRPLRDEASAAGGINVGALPVGWDVIFDPEINEWYYCDSVNKEASWEHPRARPAASDAAEAPGQAQEASVGTEAADAVVLSSDEEGAAAASARSARAPKPSVRVAGPRGVIGANAAPAPRPVAAKSSAPPLLVGAIGASQAFLAARALEARQGFGRAHGERDGSASSSSGSHGAYCRAACDARA